MNKEGRETDVPHGTVSKKAKKKKYRPEFSEPESPDIGGNFRSFR